MADNNASKTTQTFEKVADSSNVEEFLTGIYVHFVILWLQSNFRISNVLITFKCSNIEHFCPTCYVNESLDGEKFEIEREIATRD